MNFSALFIHRPIGTTLLTMALALAGVIAYQFLPVSPLPQVEFPTIEVQRRTARCQPGNRWPPRWPHRSNASSDALPG